MIAIRADANSTIGAGHLMRCLSIAAELKRIGEEVILITADEDSNPITEPSGLRTVILHSNWKRLAEETDLLIPILKQLKPSLLLVDSYLATPSYIKKLKSFTAIAYMDDLFSAVYPADVLINYNITSSPPKYKMRYKESKTTFLLNTKYAPLRSEFRCVKPFRICQKIQHILLSAGGADSYGFTTALADRLLHEKDFSSVDLIAMSGFFGANEHLVNLQRNIPHFELVQKPSAVKKAMGTCDVAISAAGSTLYELCACGIPTIVFSLADNQVEARKAFGTQKIMADCGDLRDGAQQCLDNIMKSLTLIKSPKIRTFLSKKVSNVTDGLGATRIAAVLADIAHKHQITNN